MVRHCRQRLTQFIGKRFLVSAIRCHLVRLVDNNEIPAASKQALLSVFDARNPGNGRNDLVFFLPRILAVVSTQDIATNHLEGLAEFLL